MALYLWCLMMEAKRHTAICYNFHVEFLSIGEKKNQKIKSKIKKKERKKKYKISKEALFVYKKGYTKNFK